MRLRDPSSQDPQPVKLHVLVVRGGTSNGIFENSVNLAKADLQYFEKGRHQRAELVQQQQDATAREAKARIQRANAANEKVRKNIKIGDRVKEGLVLEIKGELVKIQRYGKQCKYYSAQVNPYNGQYDCIGWKDVVTGDEWMRRDEVTAP